MQKNLEIRIHTKMSWIRNTDFNYDSYPAVLRIHDILVWIRIRGSMPLTNRSEIGSCYFCH
jgi:hypothetical protein